VGILRAERAEAEARLTALRAELVRTSEESELQEVGIYQYQHPLADAVAYKAQLADLTDRIKVMARSGTAIQSNTGWTVNGSAAQGRKMVTEYTKLMLRAYNAEADNCVARVRPHRLHSTIERLDKVAQTIARLGKTMGIQKFDEADKIRKQISSEKARIEEERDEEKERVRRGK